MVESKNRVGVDVLVVRLVSMGHHRPKNIGHICVGVQSFPGRCAGEEFDESVSSDRG